MHLVTFSALTDFPAHLEAHFKAVPEDIRTQPSGSGQDGLSASDRLKYILHVETEIYQPNIARCLQEERPELVMPDMTQAWNDQADDDETILEQFAAARKRTLSILEGFTPDQWRRVGRFGDRGETSILGLSHFLCSHDQQQLAAIQDLLGEAQAA